MKLSARGRYALAALTYMAQMQPETASAEAVTIIKIAERLGISKIYLEQTFSLLKRAGLVSSVKGAQGGYFLAKEPNQINAMDILSSVENSLFEETERTVPELAPDVDTALLQGVFIPLDEAVRQTLSAVTLADLLALADRQRADSGYMFFI